MSKPYTFSAGASIIASEHNANFDIIINSHNGNISNANISNSAAISYSKLALTGAILNADLAGSIAYSKLSLTGSIVNADLAGSIADSKLSTISTAGKVSGAALTSLSSIPGGAGVIPVANLPTFGLTFVSATTFSSENSKTITGLTTGVPYLLILDLAQVANNESLIFYPNGTLSTISATTNYSESNALKLHSSVSFGSSSVGSWHIRFRTLQGDTSKTVVLLDGFDSGTADRHSAFAVMDSDAALSNVTIAGSGGTMTLNGTAYLYKYAIV